MYKLNSKVILVNGAPRSGKGSIAKYISNKYGYLHCEMKTELFKATADLLGITLESFLEGYDDPCLIGRYKWVKDVPMYQIGHKVYSKRQALIHTSEVVLKPYGGEDIFGRKEVSKLVDNQNVVYSDSGFSVEVKPLIDKVGVDNTRIVRVFREGCTFEGDSRDYLTHKMFTEYKGLIFIDVHNSGLEELYEEVEYKLEDFLCENL